MLAHLLYSFLTLAFALHDIRPTLAPLTFVSGAAQWSVLCLSPTDGACGSPCAPSQVFGSLTAHNHLHGSLRAVFMVSWEKNWVCVNNGTLSPVIGARLVARELKLKGCTLCCHVTFSSEEVLLQCQRTTCVAKEAEADVH